MIDLDDTARCPLDLSCAACRNVAELAICTVGTPVGVFCVTLCGFCAFWNNLPRLAPVTAVGAVLEHCGHLGIDADQMAAALQSQQDLPETGPVHPTLSA